MDLIGCVQWKNGVYHIARIVLLKVWKSTNKQPATVCFVTLKGLFRLIFEFFKQKSFKRFLSRHPAIADGRVQILQNNLPVRLVILM